MYRVIILLMLLVLGQASYAQKHVISGPMIGYTELRTSSIWIELSKEVDKAYIVWWPVNESEQTAKSIVYKGVLHEDFNPVTFQLTGLEPGTEYKYQVISIINKEKKAVTGTFKTQEQWVYRKPAPDFSFLTGSCSFFNDQKYDRPGEPYGGDSSIYVSMAKTKADFMLWLGDNWYTRDVDYYSKWGLWYRAQYVRKQPVLQKFLKSMPHYAIWDDHDFGPNNFGNSYVYKDETRKVFMNYWANPSYGFEGMGIYTQLAFNDVAFFMLDDRTWRSSDNMKDSINGMPNPEKTMYGKEQMRWLKDALLQSKHASFKIIATGSQVLNTYSPYDCFYHYPIEFKELLDFITDNDIKGVIFLTGDRHRSEIIKMERDGHYTLYDITVSPLTSHRYNAGGAEKNMPTKVLNLEGKQNYGKISISGKRGERMLHIDYLDIDGKKLAEWEISQKELQD